VEVKALGQMRQQLEIARGKFNAETNQKEKKELKKKIEDS